MQLPALDSPATMPEAALQDPALGALESWLLRGLEHSEPERRLLSSRLLLSLQEHRGEIDAVRSRGGLAPWQERRAKDYIEAQLHRPLCLIEVARQCELSRSHFARSFRRSTGLPPHCWLRLRRVERAKQLMTHSSLPLAHIALACGFADQSHLSRVFARTTGCTPRMWRRGRATCPSSTTAPVPLSTTRRIP